MREYFDRNEYEENYMDYCNNYDNLWGAGNSDPLINFPNGP